MEKAFGRGFTANRNGKYALKEWDFMDSNFDRYLIFDYKGTIDFWGENMESEEYDVDPRYPRDLKKLNPRNSGDSPILLPRNSGLRQRNSTILRSIAPSMPNGENSESGCTEEWRKPRMNQ